MVLAHHGRACTEVEVRQHLGTGPHGTPARNIFLVRSLGFDVEVESSSLSQLARILGEGVPPIVFLETTYLDYWQRRCDHVAVLVGIDLAAAYLNDPNFDTAPQQTSLSGFQRAWASNEQLAAFIRPRT
jgi:ABC-type bacteriocin/lantibiotic exporter with double-glycine peptidase domain